MTQLIALFASRGRRAPWDLTAPTRRSLDALARVTTRTQRKAT